jgi:dihydroorotate dehydrogenase (fumarate)
LRGHVLGSKLTAVEDFRGLEIVRYADVVMMTSALLRHGPAHLTRVQAQLVGWLAEHEYTSIAQLRGSVSHRGAADPTGYERANYLRTLASYRPVV